MYNMASAGDVVLSPSSVNRLNRSRKRKVNMSEWKDIKRKKLRDQGKAYISRRGKNIAAKQPPNEDRACNPEHCFKDGCLELKANKKQKLYEEFHSLSYDEQSSLLVACTSVSEPKRRKKGKNDATSRRTCTFTYTIGGKQVCQKTILDTYSITQRRIQTLQSKIKDGIVSPKDQRGRHNNRPHTIDDKVKQCIREHILSFPMQPSHYCRMKSEKECLSPDLNLSRMYQLFKQSYPRVAVSRSLYEEIFRNDFSHLRFGLPRSDSCRHCDLLFIKLTAAANESERRAIEIESELHHAKAEQAYSNLKSDTIAATKSKNIVTICVDMQQVLFCPTLTHSSMFYQRQLSCYNFAIHDMGSGAVNMYVWHEGLGKRGSAEIASCILKFTVENYSVLLPGEERKMIVWSDRCTGQNNNWRIISLYKYLMTCGYFTEVHQKFLCSGHSFLPCDRDFAVIEKRKRVSQVMVPMQWKYVIGEASLKKPFTVTELQQTDFKDLSKIESSLNRDCGLKITKVMWLKLSSDDPTALCARETHNILRPWERYIILNKKTAKSMNSVSVGPLPQNLPVLYVSSLPITKEKKKDLLDMCKYISPEYRNFYENLPCKD